MTEPNGAKAPKSTPSSTRWATYSHCSVTAAGEQDRAQVGALAAKVQSVTGDHVELAYVDQGYTGAAPAQEAAAHVFKLEVIKFDQAKRGFVLLPRRWVVERSFDWAARVRRLARDYERLASSLLGLHWIAFVYHLP